MIPDDIMNGRYYNELLNAYLRAATGEMSCMDEGRLMETARSRGVLRFQAEPAFAASCKDGVGLSQSPVL